MVEKKTKCSICAGLVSSLLFACSAADVGAPTNQDPGDPNGAGSIDSGSTGSKSDAGSSTPPHADGGSSHPGADASASMDTGGGTPSPDAGTVVTWTSIFNNYLAGGTSADCVSCHSSMGSPSNAYNHLASLGYISGTSSMLVVSGQSPLTWYGGNMPPSGPSSYPQAVADMNAWVAAGAHNN